MITLFIIFMLLIFGKLGIFALKAAWGITKLVFFLMFLPGILIVMALAGLIYLALPLLITVGIVSLFTKAVSR